MRIKHAGIHMVLKLSLPSLPCSHGGHHRHPIRTGVAITLSIVFVPPVSCKTKTPTLPPDVDSPRIKRNHLCLTEIFS